MTAAGVAADAGVRAVAAGAKRRLVIGAVIGEVLLSLALGCFHLGDESLWRDEGFTAMVTGGSWGSVLDHARDLDSNMFSYNLLLHAWRIVGGDSEAALRSLSVVATAAAVFVVFMVGSRLYGDAAGVIAGLVLAIAPFGVRYAQEARSYALLVLLVSVASYLFIIGIERPSWPTWICYSVVAALACYTHLFGGLVVLAHASSLMFLGRHNRPWRHVAGAAALLAGLLLPLGVLLAGRPTSQIDWISRPTLYDVAAATARVSGGSVLVLVFGTFCAVLFILAWQAWSDDRTSLQTWRYGFTASWIAVPPAAALAFSIAVKPIFFDRYLIVVLPGLAVAAGLVIARLRRVWMIAAVLAVVVGLSALRIADWYERPTFEDWRGAVEYVAKSATPADGVVFCSTHGRPPFEFYELRQPPSSRPQPLSPSAPWGLRVRWRPATTSQVTAWRRAQSRIWVIQTQKRPGHGAGACDLPDSMAPRVRADVRQLRGVRVERYDPA